MRFRASHAWWTAQALGARWSRSDAKSVGETSSLRSSYERGCQGKKILPAPPRDAGVVTYIQPHLIPHLILRGVIGLVALACRTSPRRCHQAKPPSKTVAQANTFAGV